MKRFMLYLVFFLAPSFSLLGASDSEQVLKKLDSLEDTINTLSLRILVLEKKIISLEETLFLVPTKKAGKNPRNISGSEKKPRKIPEPEDYVFSDGDFTIEHVTHETHYNDTIFRGTITNKSNNNYRYALFKISVYGNKGAVLSSNDFYILNFDKGTQRQFEAKIHGFKKEEFERYTIEFNKGS